MSLFERIAAEQRIRQPKPFAAWADWEAYCRRVWAKFPGWAWDSAYLTEAAREFLPRIMAEMGMGRMCGYLAPASISHAIAGRGAPLATLPLYSDGRWMMFRLAPASDTYLAFDEHSHAWRCPQLARAGADLVELGAWKWETTEARAARRIARLCGLERPAP